MFSNPKQIFFLYFNLINYIYLLSYLFLFALVINYMLNKIDTCVVFLRNVAGCYFGISIQIKICMKWSWNMSSIWICLEKKNRFCITELWYEEINSLNIYISTFLNISLNIEFITFILFNLFNKVNIFAIWIYK